MMNARQPISNTSTTVVGTPAPHDSATLHVAGQATYTDDLPEPRGMLHAALGVSPLPHGMIDSIGLDAVRTAPGVVAVLTASDIPGINDVGPIQRDDPILAERIVEFAGNRCLQWRQRASTLRVAPRRWPNFASRRCRRS